jgi:hypothetical protein
MIMKKNNLKLSLLCAAIMFACGCAAVGKLNTPSGRPEVTMPYVTKSLGMFETAVWCSEHSTYLIAKTDSSLTAQWDVPKPKPGGAVTLHYIFDFKYAQRDTGTTVYLTTRYVSLVNHLVWNSSGQAYYEKSLDTGFLDGQDDYQYSQERLEKIDSACRNPKYKAQHGDWHNTEWMGDRIDSVTDARMGDPRYTLPNGSLIIVDSTQ